MTDTRASGAGKRVHARWDTGNRLAPDEMEAYEAAAERKDMGGVATFRPTMAVTCPSPPSRLRPSRAATSAPASASPPLARP